jgi:hypothetical protein
MIQPSNGKGTWLQHARMLSAGARFNGTYILGAKGSGKSTLEAELAWYDFLRRIGQIIIDPIGVGTTDSFLWKLIRFLYKIPFSSYSRYLERIKYVNIAAKDYIVPFPLIYKTGSERSLLEVAERYLHTILISSPWLLHAQVQGWPPLHYVGSQTAIVLAALNYPLTFAQDLLRHPEVWEREGRFAEAVRRYPEAAPAVAFFQEEYIPAGQANRRRLLNPYFDKIFTFTLDPNLRAMFGATKPGIDWEEVERKGQTVLLDFRQEIDPELRRFKLLWVFSSLYEYIRVRGRQEQPLGLIIDEFASLCHKVPAGENPMAVILDEFINQYMRNYHIWLTVAHQSIYQIDEQLRNTLLSLGTYVFARAATMSEARILADVLYKRDPYVVKHWRKVWGNEAILNSAGRIIGSSHVVIDHEPEFMPLDEQQERFAQRINEQGLFEFLLRPALREGEVSQEVIPISIANTVLDTETGEYQFPNQGGVAKLRSLLAAHAGMPVQTLLKEQEARLPRGIAGRDGHLRLLPATGQRTTQRPTPKSGVRESSMPHGTDAQTSTPLPAQPIPAIRHRRRVS